MKLKKIHRIFALLIVLTICLSSCGNLQEEYDDDYDYDYSNTTKSRTTTNPRTNTEEPSSEAATTETEEPSSETALTDTEEPTTEPDSDTGEPETGEPSDPEELNIGDLPIIRIETADEAPINSKINYTAMSFTLQEGTEEVLTADGEIRIRGNSTAGYPKKPYRIKFEKKQELFGLTKAKSWVLLADYLDPSSLHNYTALTLGGYSDGLAFTPTPNHVNLYVNGEYQGLYLLCEQVQENKGRLNIEQTITEDMVSLKDFNFLVCMDSVAEYDWDAVQDETYFLLDEENDSRCIELKYPEKADFKSEEQFRSFVNQLKEYLNDVYRSFREQDEEAIRSFTDLNSLADYLLVDQIMGEMEHTKKSFFFYQTAAPDESSPAILHFGPIWDYDFCLYNSWTGEPNNKYEMNTSVNYFTNVFFKAMANVESFDLLVRQRYAEWASDALENTILAVHAEEERIADALLADAAIWYENDADLVRNNVDFLYAFLARRQELLAERWKIPDSVEQIE